MNAFKRTIEQAIKQYAKKYPVLAVTGPRQSGKTTMLKTMFSDYTYVSLENPDMREFATKDPNGFFAYYAGNLILDEVQQTLHFFLTSKHLLTRQVKWDNLFYRVHRIFSL